jgi:hypothetical protein
MNWSAQAGAEKRQQRTWPSTLRFMSEWEE